MSKVHHGKRFCLVSDEEGHYYVIPVNKQKEASKYFVEVSDFWCPHRNWDDGAEEPEKPKWLVVVGGSPSRVEFENWSIT